MKFSSKKKIVVIIVYVDDIILTGDYGDELLRLKKLIAKEFKIKDLGPSRILPRYGSGSIKERNCHLSTEVHPRHTQRDKHAWMQANRHSIGLY